MLDELLAFGASFDWVTPLIDLWKDLTQGPHQDFYVDRGAGWSANQIRRLLKSRGVRLWGLSYKSEQIEIGPDWIGVVPELIGFRVRQNQSLLAQSTLEQAGIPILGGAL